MHRHWTEPLRAAGGSTASFEATINAFNMVNIGRPSGGCEVCKKRKIKCDEERPFCRRCEKSGRVCPGVPEPEALALRTLARTSNRNPTHSRLADVSSSEHHDDSGVDRGLQYPIELQAITLFFNDYAMRPVDPRLRQRPIFLLPGIYASSSIRDPVHDALCASTLNILARYVNAPQLRVLAQQKYFDGLRSLRRSLQSSNQALSDGVLGGILMLKVYEVS